MTDVAMGAVPAPRAGSPESPVGRSEAVAHTAEAGGHALEIQMLRVGAQLLRVGRQAGSRRGATPLLMFNGIGGSIELLEPLARAMPAREVIVFDVPGVGHSPMPRRPYRLRTLARWALGVLDHFGHAQADVLDAVDAVDGRRPSARPAELGRLRRRRWHDRVLLVGLR